MQATDVGVAHFYYSRSIPGDGVAIARVRASEVKPADLCSVDTTPYGMAVLKATAFDTGTQFIAPGLYKYVAITGSTKYQIDNQFFELTNVLDTASKPMFYQHAFAAANITNASILDLNRNVVNLSPYIQDNILYHSMNGDCYWVEYYVNGQVQTELLRYDATMSRVLYNPQGSKYVLSAGGGLTIDSSAKTFWIRFYANNGYTVLAPYNVPLNDPWYPRIRFNLKPIAQEWGLMPFSPTRPYLQATWVPGKVLSSSVIEFERDHLKWDGVTYPDVLVYDKDYNLKYALDGSGPDSEANKGYLFPWMRAQFLAIDPRWARVQVMVPLEPTDVVFGFYYYHERDVIFSWLDMNPFVNPALKNKTVKFYFATRTQAPFQNIFYQVFNEDGTPVLDGSNNPITNDPQLVALGIGTVFGSIVAGWSVGPDDFELTDIRQRGGGLRPDSENIPQANHFWDIGYWDGRPYPISGALPIYLPKGLLDRMSRDEIRSRVEALVPAGSMPLIRFYDGTGEETL